MLLYKIKNKEGRIGRKGKHFCFLWWRKSKIRFPFGTFGIKAGKVVSLVRPQFVRYEVLRGWICKGWPAYWWGEALDEQMMDSIDKPVVDRSYSSNVKAKRFLRLGRWLERRRFTLAPTGKGCHTVSQAFPTERKVPLSYRLFGYFYHSVNMANFWKSKDIFTNLFLHKWCLVWSALASEASAFLAYWILKKSAILRSLGGQSWMHKLFNKICW